MKRFFHFIRTTTIGGVVVIIPMAIILYATGAIVVPFFDAAMELSDGMPFSPLANSLIAISAALIIAVAIFFFAGLLMRTFWGNAVQNWLETKLFSRIPMYSALKGLAKRFTGMETAGFPVVEVDLYGSDIRVIGVAVERLPDGRQAIYIPSSPIASIGQMVVAPDEAITILDVPLTDMLTAVSQRGIESGSRYRTR